ncbi:DUF4279 domain-containing protein [Brevundimonas sp.]|uniref:DUF4279 domain-containing protein n=1 Tax=Brevundimonas sp. TaxID=1871086 RepID=UPI002D334907|nr:DUF4279 domain-containing protein [Brevundimonas sp.]HYC97466.1 DUF4279 domain-containing protein [Brevundimonas sp.]
MLTLGITGFDGNPQIVTDILDIQPTSVVLAGDVTRSGRVAKFSGWWLEARADRLTGGADHDHAVKALVGAVRGRAEAFQTLRKRVRPKEVTIYGGLHHRGDSQCGIWLDAEDMLCLGECGIAWGLDLFGDDR